MISDEVGRVRVAGLVHHHRLIRISGIIAYNASHGVEAVGRVYQGPVTIRTQLAHPSSYDLTQEHLCEARLRRKIVPIAAIHVCSVISCVGRSTEVAWIAAKIQSDLAGSHGLPIHGGLFDARYYYRFH